jgi:hypothetical protein
MLRLNTSLDTDRYSASSFSAAGPRLQVVERAQSLTEAEITEVWVRLLDDLWQGFALDPARQPSDPRLECRKSLGRNAPLAAPSAPERTFKTIFERFECAGLGV